MSDTVISVEKLSKQYRLGSINHGTLKADLASWWARLRGQEDPNLRVDPSGNIESIRDQPDRFWALRDVNFELKQGEVLGVIGRNGAGKSTLLKLLSRVTAPTHGQINVKGRIASLLEVGTGFHPDLTGLENIYINGAILGLTKNEIRGRLDEIIDFAEIEGFIDTPVKRYSSGMYVRLAFSVAAHLDPEILVVDEVLAVGDAEFQKKCLGKMNQVSKSGRTVLFVSHQMNAVRSICSSALLLENGQVRGLGAVDAIVEGYFADKNGESAENGVFLPENNSSKPSRIISVRLEQNENADTGHIRDDIGFHIVIELINRKAISPFQLCISLYDGEQHSVFSTRTDIEVSSTIQTYRLSVEGRYLSDGSYSMFIGIMDRQFSRIDVYDHVCRFSVVRVADNNPAFPGSLRGCVFPRCDWLKDG